MKSKVLLFNRFPVFIFLVLIWASANAQSVEQNVIGSAGEHVVGSGVQLSWTIGEVVTETAVSPTHQLTQGFHQTFLTVTRISAHNSLPISVFPNPTLGSVNVLPGDLKGKIVAEVYNVTGTLLYRQDILENTPNTLSLAPYASGTYLLKFTTPDNTTGTYKIIKTN